MITTFPVKITFLQCSLILHLNRICKFNSVSKKNMFMPSLNIRTVLKQVMKRIYHSLNEWHSMAAVFIIWFFTVCTTFYCIPCRKVSFKLFLNQGWMDSTEGIEFSYHLCTASKLVPLSLRPQSRCNSGNACSCESVSRIISNLNINDNIQFQWLQISNNTTGSVWAIDDLKNSVPITKIICTST